MTALVLLLTIVALFCAIGLSRQTIRTLGAWQQALEAIHAELRGRQTSSGRDVLPTQAPSSMLGHVPEISGTSSCPCTCHPLPPTTRQPWA